MKLKLKENPNNSTKLWLCSVFDDQEEKIMLMFPYHFTRPFRSTDPDPDPLIVQGLKLASGSVTGFATWQAAATFIDGIEDPLAYASALGHSLEDLLK